MNLSLRPAYSSLNLTKPEQKFISLCIQDHLDQLELFPQLDQLKYDTLAMGYIEGASFGSLRIMKFLEQFLQKRDKIDFDQEIKGKALHWAWPCQHLKVIEYLSPGEGFLFACQEGNLDLLNGVVELTTLKPETLTDGYVKASHAGHLETMQILENLEKLELTQKMIESAIFWASMADHLNVLKYLVPKLTNRKKLKQCLEFSIGKGQLEAFKYLLTFPVISSDEDYLKQVFRGMATGGYPKALNHFLAHTSFGQDQAAIEQALDLTSQALQSAKERYPSEGDRIHFHVANLIKNIEHLNIYLRFKSGKTNGQISPDEEN